jgi:hypothetical protein
MNVYPVNAMEGAVLNSRQREAHSHMIDIHNKYLEFTVDFSRPEIKIYGKWDKQVQADTFIVANTNAEAGNIRLKLRGDVVLEKHFATKEYINIIDFEGLKQFDEIVLGFQGEANVKIGLLFTGEKWTLPRFVALPRKTLSLRNEGGRTFSGQVTGIPVNTLKTFGCGFVRIKNEEVKKINDYINGVQTIIPHIIDVYPKARQEFPPFFATVTEYGEKEKRAENGFFWNFEIAWMEAR